MFQKESNTLSLPVRVEVVGSARFPCVVCTDCPLLERYLEKKGMTFLRGTAPPGFQVQLTNGLKEKRHAYSRPLYRYIVDKDDREIAFIITSHSEIRSACYVCRSIDVCSLPDEKAGRAAILFHKSVIRYMKSVDEAVKILNEHIKGWICPYVWGDVTKKGLEKALQDDIVHTRVSIVEAIDTLKKSGYACRYILDEEKK